jgi:hypothetical protein
MRSARALQLLSRWFVVRRYDAALVMFVVMVVMVLTMALPRCLCAQRLIVQISPRPQPLAII